ncbi:MAG: IS110 family transposase [Verrucomicrobia bacterium]|nr:IS110 family transposase [Verrucomicrobiota bacterium]
MSFLGNVPLQEAIEAVLAIYEALEVQIRPLENRLTAIAKRDEDTKLLMTISGVGVITALNFKVTIGDPKRFEASRKVGAYVGMTPKQYSSGERERQGGISKCGCKQTRSLLVEAAVVLLTRTKKWSKLKAWGFKIFRKHGIKKAAVAVGRKLAVIMHRMLITREIFRITEETTEAKKEQKAA